MKSNPVLRCAMLLSLSCALTLSACTRKTQPDTSTLPHELHWPEVGGADSYLVRAWSGYRLLFAQSSSDTVLALNENMLRVLAGCDSVSLEVKALDAGDVPLEGGHRRYPLPQFSKGR